MGEGQLFLIAGPCVIESEAHVRKMADAIQRIASDLRIPYIFKASFDKANRTSVKSFRGPGLVEGTRILGCLAKDTGLPVLTDVHEPSQCEVAAPSEAEAKQWEQSYLKNYARELLREYGGQTVRVQRVTHFPLYRQDALKNMPLDDPHTFKTEMEVTQRRQDLDLPAPTQGGAWNGQMRRDIASGWQGERR